MTSAVEKIIAGKRGMEMRLMVGMLEILSWAVRKGLMEKTTICSMGLWGHNCLSRWNDQEYLRRCCR